MSEEQERSAGLVEEIETDIEEDLGLKGAGEPWFATVALSTALIAALAAVAALLSALETDENLRLKIEETIEWSSYNTAITEQLILRSRNEVLAAMGEPVEPEAAQRLKGYLEEARAERERFEEAKLESERAMHSHHILAVAVTLFQIAIAMNAICLISRLKPMWYVGFVFAAGGVAFLVWGLLP